MSSNRLLEGLDAGSWKASIELTRCNALFLPGLSFVSAQDCFLETEFALIAAVSGVETVVSHGESSEDGLELVFHDGYTGAAGPMGIGEDDSTFARFADVFAWLVCDRDAYEDLAALV